jgi:hypothetical protein
MMNTAKARNIRHAAADLAGVILTAGGSSRSRLSRVTQRQLQAIQDGRRAAQGLKELQADMAFQVERAEALVIEAMQRGAPVSNGLITPCITYTTRIARISWRSATERFVEMLGLNFKDTHAGLKAEVAPNDVTVTTLTLGA